jgi:outer membrane biosynthesis protein TonB
MAARVAASEVRLAAKGSDLSGAIRAAAAPPPDDAPVWRQVAMAAGLAAGLALAPGCRRHDPVPQVSEMVAEPPPVSAPGTIPEVHPTSDTGAPKDPNPPKDPPPPPPDPTPPPHPVPPEPKPHRDVTMPSEMAAVPPDEAHRRAALQAIMAVEMVASPPPQPVEPPSPLPTLTAPERVDVGTGDADAIRGALVGRANALRTYLRDQHPSETHAGRFVVHFRVDAGRVSAVSLVEDTSGYGATAVRFLRSARFGSTVTGEADIAWTVEPGK